MMDTPAVQNDEPCVEKNKLIFKEPNILFDKNFCKIFTNNETCLGENDILKLIEIIQVNSIRRLELPKCRLLDFPLNLCSLDSITHLHLSGNKLENLPDEFVNFKKLRYLDISDNLLYELPHVLYSGLHLIKSLDVSKNQISFLCKPPCCLAKLHFLNISSNKLVEPPPWLLDDLPSCLQVLGLSNNPCFENYLINTNTWSENKNKVASGIKLLKMSNCQFRESLCSYLENFRSLNILDIGNQVNIPLHVKSSNYVTSLKCSLPLSIEKLDMVNLGLGTLSSSITDLSNLRYLDISYNTIHWFPASIKNLKSLTVLNARCCSLCIIPSEMNLLRGLSELYLSSNQLSSSEGFERLDNLRVIDLYGNQFISWPDFNRFPKLQYLDLCQNYVEPPSIIEINGLEYDYVDLKTKLRSKINSPDRKDGEREFTATPEELSDDGVDDTSLEEEFCDAESEDTYVVQNENRENISYQCEELWETDETEEFDPDAWSRTGASKMTRKDSYESLTGEIPYTVTIHPHYFTPYKQVTPVVNKTTLPPPVEGQFDD